MSTWKQHLENITSKTVSSANLAVDYLVGNQIDPLRKILDEVPGRGIKDWMSRGVEPVVNNVTMKIISRSANSYNDPPKRTIHVGDTENDQASSRYADILRGDGETYIEASDLYSRLLKLTMLLVQYVTETGEYSFSVLHRGNCDVDYNRITGAVESLLYTADAPGPAGGRMYHHWTPERIIDIEIQENKAGKVIAEQPNTYGIVPVAILRDIGKPIAGFWPNAAWQELIRLNEIINQFSTEMRFASKMQTFPSRVTNAKIKDGQVEGVDSIVELEYSGGDTPIFYEHSAPTVNLSEFRLAYSDLVEDIADNWGVNLEVGGSAAANSGFQLLVMENSSLEMRKKRIKSAKAFEEELFYIVATIDQAIGGSLRPDTMSVVTDFAEPALAVDTKTDREQDRLDVAAGLMTKRDWILKYNPDITPADLAERLQDGAALPNFDAQVN